MIEHDLSIGGQPGISLETIGAEALGEEKRWDCVLRRVGSSTPVGEGNGLRPERGQALLHPRRLGRHSYAEVVFNLSGSEMIFLLLAGLVVLGPDRLPGFIRRAGRTYGDVRRTMREYEREFRETFKEPIQEMQSTVSEMKSAFGTIDPVPSPPMRPEKAVAQSAETESSDTSSAPEPIGVGGADASADGPTPGSKDVVDG